MSHTTLLTIITPDKHQTAVRFTNSIYFYANYIRKGNFDFVTHRTCRDWGYVQKGQLRNLIFLFDFVWWLGFKWGFLHGNSSTSRWVVFQQNVFHWNEVSLNIWRLHIPVKPSRRNICSSIFPNLHIEVCQQNGRTRAQVKCRYEIP